MDGPEVCKSLRKTDSPSPTYIMLLTVKDGKDNLIRGLQAGADDYVTKPFDPEELRARIRVGQRIVDLQRKMIEQETAFYVQQLEQAVLDLQESRSRIVSVQEDLRRTIAEELHGHIQTQLVLMAFKISDIEDKIVSNPNEAQEDLSQLSDQLDNLRENEIRRISHRLHPSVIKLSLASGLRSLQDQFEGALDVNLSISDDLAELESGGGSEIDHQVRLCLYRVAEEALGNVMKHAEASSVSLRLWLETGPTRIALAVEDNGKGFVRAKQAKRSIGLVTMEDYVGALGGTLNIETASGRGTKVSAYVPLEIEKKNDLKSEELLSRQA